MSAAIAVTAYGVYSAKKSADKAADAQQAATAAATEASEEALAFEMQKHEEWQSIFGGVQEQLGQYYEEYDAETIEALGIQNIEQEYAVAQENINKSLAQRGITGSGVEAGAITSLELSRAAGKAGVKAAAPHQAMQAKEGFLSLGLGQGSDRSNVSGVLQNISQAQYGQASAYGSLAAQAGQTYGAGVTQLQSQLNPYVQRGVTAIGNYASGFLDNTFATTTPTAGGGYTTSSAYDTQAGWY